jgi:hypothetical protein
MDDLLEAAFVTQIVDESLCEQTTSTTTATTTTTITKTVNSCPDGLDGYERVGNRRHTNNNQRIAALQAIADRNTCAELCSSTAGCSYFIFRTLNGACFHFSSTPSTSANNAFIAHTRLYNCETSTTATLTTETGTTTTTSDTTTTTETETTITTLTTTSTTVTQSTTTIGCVGSLYAGPIVNKKGRNTFRIAAASGVPLEQCLAECTADVNCVGISHAVSDDKSLT